MAGKKYTGELVVSPRMIFVFPNLFVPKAFERNGKPTGEPVYGFTGLIKPTDPDLAKLKGALKKAAEAAWPGRNLGELQFPLKDGDKEADRLVAKGKSEEQVAFYRGHVVVKASSKYPPGIVDAKRENILDKSLIHSGVEGWAELNCVPYDAIQDGAKDGVTCYFNFVMRANGAFKRIAGRDANSAFAGIDGGTSATDPTGGANGDILI